ncbi:MAG: hypothetical protein E6K54_00050 [Gammaproteobacteria bacterium]|nr:MAG: hypothetical protein E6K54_00050 [Gammaproteobacteria bacterium]
MSQPDDGEYLPPTKKARYDSGNSTLITEIGECKTDPGLHKCAYYYVQTVFYKDGEVAQRLEFRKYLNEDVSMYDSVEVFLPGYLPVVRELRENDYKFDQRRQLYKHTIDLRGVDKLVLRNDLRVEREFACHYSGASSSSVASCSLSSSDYEDSVDSVEDEDNI